MLYFHFTYNFSNIFEDVEHSCLVSLYLQLNKVILHLIVTLQLFKKIKNTHHVQSCKEGLRSTRWELETWSSDRDFCPQEPTLGNSQLLFQGIWLDCFGLCSTFQYKYVHTDIHTYISKIEECTINWVFQFITPWFYIETQVSSTSEYSCVYRSGLQRGNMVTKMNSIPLDWLS